MTLYQIAELMYRQCRDPKGDRTSTTIGEKHMITLDKEGINWKLTIERGKGKQQPDPSAVDTIRSIFSVPTDAVSVTKEIQVQKHVGPVAMTTETIVEIEWQERTA